MAACTRVLLAYILALILLPCAQAEQTRKSFGPWSVLCSGGASGYCSARSRIKSVAGPYRFQLNVSRERPGADFELALLTGYQHPAESSAIAVQVDTGKVLRLARGEGYRRAGRSNTYILATVETQGLLEQMRSGKRIRFRFEDAKGATVDAAFPLAGLSGAMRFMDKAQPAPRGIAPKAAAGPAEKLPAVEDRKPAPEPEAAVRERSTPKQEPPSAPTVAPAPAEKARTSASAAKLSTPTQEPPSARVIAPAPTEKAGTSASAAPTQEPPSARTAAPAATEKAGTSASAVKQPTPAAAPVAKEVTPSPGAAPMPSAHGAAPAPVVAAAPVVETKPKPAPEQTAEGAPPPARKPATEARRSPAQTQKQVAVTAAPTASRKRGAKSIRQFSCRGSEPSWTFVIDGDSAWYSSPTGSGQPDSIELAGKLNVTGDGPTPVVDWRGKSDWGGSFRAVVTEQRCRDGMSDTEGQTELEYRAQVTLPDRKTLRGCCNAGLPPVKAAAPVDTTQYPVADLRSRPETDWSRYLLDLLPAIQACIDKTPEPAPYATKAWPMNRGMVGVRTRNDKGGWFECVAASNGKSIDRFIPLPSSAPPAPNEDHVVFSPPDQPPPEGNCYKQHERVMDGMGDFMGWLSTSSCS